MSNKEGRPTSYKKEYNKEVIKLCRLGATDLEIADFFGICEATLYNWKHEHPEFLEAIKEGKIQSDANVSNSLYKRACGYMKEGRHYPPDPTAMIFWLKNRRKVEWRDKHDINHSGGIDVKGQFDNLSDDEIKKLAEKLKNAAK